MSTIFIHPEGVAGAIAVAIAASMTWQLRENPDWGRCFFDAGLRHTPESGVRQGVLLARTTPPEIPITDGTQVLGNGSLVTASDTVPFCLWMVARNARPFVEAIGKTISAGGDCDTNAAIVGGIVALSAGRKSIPDEWLQARETIHP